MTATPAMPTPAEEAPATTPHPATLRVPATTAGSALILRPWTADDARPLVEVYQDPAMRRWVRVPIRDHAEATDWVAAQEAGWRTGNRLSFAVHDDEHGLVGCVVLKQPHTNPEVGYWTSAPVRGRGVASRAVEALCQWAFTVMGLMRIELRHQVDNTASCRVAEKAGFTLHATLPAAPPYPLDGHLHIRHAPTPA